MTFLLSNVVRNAVIGKDNSLLGGMVGAVTLVSLNVAVNRLIAVNATDARIFEGRATTVISDGHILNRAFRHLRPHRRRLGRGHAGAAQSGPAREAGRTTGFIVRERYEYSRRWSALLVEPVEIISFIMSQKMLRGIRDRAQKRCVR